MTMNLSRRRVLAMLATLSVAAIVGAEPSAPASPPGPPLPPGKVRIAVEDLHCGTCAKKVARKLYALKGVRKVTWDVPADRMEVLLPANKPVPVLSIWSAVIAGGSKPVELRYGAERLDAAAITALQQQAQARRATRR